MPAFESHRLCLLQSQGTPALLNALVAAVGFSCLGRGLKKQPPWGGGGVICCEMTTSLHGVVTGTLPPATIGAPAAASGLSRIGRGLKQLPATYASGGLAILQQLQRTFTQGLQTSQPAVDATLAALNASLTAPAPAQVGHPPPPPTHTHPSQSKIERHDDWSALVTGVPCTPHSFGSPAL